MLRHVTASCQKPSLPPFALRGVCPPQEQRRRGVASAAVGKANEVERASGGGAEESDRGFASTRCPALLFGVSRRGSFDLETLHRIDLQLDLE